MCEKHEIESPQAAGETATTEPSATVELSGFSSDEVLRLEAQRACVAQGTLNEDPTVYRRLRFVRWLHAQSQESSPN